LKDADKTKAQLVSELVELRQQLSVLAAPDTALKRSEERLAKVSECFLNFGTDALENINRMTALCGELLGATCALYNRLHRGLLYSWGQWDTPPDYNPADKPEGHICYDVIKTAGDKVLVVSNLSDTHYAETDPNVIPYKLQTYVGRAVKLGNDYVGSLCVVFQDDFMPDERDERLMEIIASAIGVEEKRKQAEEKLQQKITELDSFLNNIPDMAWLKDSESRFIAVNQAFGEAVEMDPESLLNQTCEVCFGEEEGKKFQEDDRKVIESGKQQVLEEQIVDSRGKEVWLETIKSPILDKSGEVRGTVGIAREITKRKQAEEALKASEARYRAVVEDQAELICRFLSDGTLTFVNDAYCRYFGKKREELIGYSFMPLIPAGDQEVVREKLVSLSPDKPLVTYEHRVLLPDGEIQWQRWTDRAIFDEQNRLIEYQSVGHDVTERKLAEEELQKAHAELERRVDERTADLVRLNEKLKLEIEERKLAEQELKKREAQLEIQTSELEEVNTALRVLLKRRDEDKTEFEEKVLYNVKELVVPYLERLKSGELDAKQTTYVSILESNLNDIVSSFTRKLSSKYLGLTPTEIQIANLVKQGRTTKEIAEILHSSDRTVEFHRKNIRKKIGLVNRKVNLRSHLLSM
jgi:PAS domain S-box-containing protein